VKKDLFHYLHKKHLALLPKITAVIRSMKEDGELELLKAQYLAEFL